MAMDAYGLEIPSLVEDEEEEDEGTLSTAPKDWAARITTAVQDTQKRQEALDQQRMAMIQQATERLRQQQAGPSLAEQLFRISAAFAQPSRTKGLAGVLGNVMPVMAQNASESQAAKTAKQDLLEKYQLGMLDMQSTASGNQLKNLLAAYKAMGGAGKTTKPRIVTDPKTGRSYVEENPGTPEAYLRELPRVSADAGQSLPRVSSEDEVSALPPGSEFIGPDGKKYRKPGGPTGGSPSSGGF